MTRTTAATAQATSAAEHEAYVRRLVEAERIGDARQYVDALPAGLSPQIEGWRRVLAPPVVRLAGRATGKSMRADEEWLRQHPVEYAGQWVALRDGELVDRDASEVALAARVRGLEGVFLTRAPEPLDG